MDCERINEVKVLQERLCHVAISENLLHREVSDDRSDGAEEGSFTVTTGL